MRVTGIPFVQGRNYSADTDGQKYGIAIHNTSNDASAEAEASYATRRTDSVSSHFYCDNNSMIQSLDTNVKAWHAGSSIGNNNAIAVEITGVNSWTRAQWLSNVAWDILGKSLAQVCKHYGIPVARLSVQTMHDRPTTKGFYGHDDMRRAWGGTTHTDPGPNFPWDKLFDSVKKYLSTLPYYRNGSRMLSLKSPMMRGTDVLYVQHHVGAGADGIYGPGTKAAVITFQKQHRLTADGIVGPNTWHALGV